MISAVAVLTLLFASRPSFAAPNMRAAAATSATAVQELTAIATDLQPAKTVFIGKWIAPIMYLGAFALLANGLMHLDPDRARASEVGVGAITLTAGLMWWPFLIAMMVEQGIGPLTNIVTGLAGMYAFFFIALGVTQIFKIPSKKQLGAVAILIAWLTGVYALFFLTTPAPNGGGTWVYHFTIAFVWFLAMNLAGLFMQGKWVNEKVLGWTVTFAAMYTFAVPAVLWSMPVGHQGPF